MPGHPPRRFSSRPAAIRWQVICACVVLAARLGAVPLPLEYHTRFWTVEAGLPHNSVSLTLQDSTGFLWFATLGGLARYDGREFREMRPPVEYRPRGFNIRGLAEEKPGTLIVATTGPTVLRLAGTAWSIHPASRTLAALNDEPDEAFVDPAGNLWLTTMARRLLRSDVNGETEVVVGPASVRGPRFTLASDHQGQVWISADSILHIFRDGALQPVEFGLEKPLTIVPGQGGRIWVCTPQRLHCLEDGVLTVKSEEAPWGKESGYLRALFEDTEGRVWILSSQRGLYRFEDGHMQALPVAQPHMRHIAKDREGNLWIATEGLGVAQLGEKAYRIFGTGSGLEHEVVSSISEGPDGRMWLANRLGGLVPIAPDGTIESSLIRSSPEFLTNVVCVDAANRIWFGNSRRGLRRWTPGTEDVKEMESLRERRVRMLYRAENDDMWFVADAGLIGYFRNDEYHLISREHGFMAEEVLAIAEDGSGNVWLGSRTGDLLRWDGAKMERIPAPPRSGGSPIHAIMADSADRLWIGTASGLILKEGANLHVFTQAEGLADDLLEQVLEDDHGRLWLGSRRGFYFVAKSELLEVARSGGRVLSYHVGHSQGLAGGKSILNFDPSACKSRDGQLWFATMQGAVVIDPNKLLRDLPPPTVLINEVRIDGRSVEPTENLKVGPGAQRVEFRLSALTFTAPENVVLRHRLEKLDRDWIDTGVERTASYMNLPPGDYRLRVSARSSMGPWNTDGASLAFTVVPAWWERLSFRFLLAVLVTGATAALARAFAQRRLKLKLRRLEQEHALEKERARIARDLHDDFGANLTAISLEADRLLSAVPRELSPQVSGLARRTRHLATELSGIVWTISEGNSSLDRLAEFLRRYAERLFRNTGVSCRAIGVEGIPAVPIAPDAQHQLLAATKEALNNVLKHARATEAQIEVHYTQGVFEVRVVDNGAGFSLDPAKRPSGNGLRNMRFRLEEIGGTCAIKSEPGTGTQVAFRFPCAPGDHLA